MVCSCDDVQLRSTSSFFACLNFSPPRLLLDSLCMYVRAQIFSVHKNRERFKKEKLSSSERQFKKCVYWISIAEFSSAQLSSARFGSDACILYIDIKCCVRFYASLYVGLCHILYLFIFSSSVILLLTTLVIRARKHSRSILLRFLWQKRHQRSNEWNDLKYTYTAEEKKIGQLKMLKNENKTIQTDSINRQENVLTKKNVFFFT